MTRVILRRLFSLPFVILSITIITFLVGYLAPGDPILSMMGSRRDPVTYERLRHLYGLDQPWYEQYVDYASGLLQGDLGLSYRYQGRPVWDLIGNGVFVSVQLGLAALILSLSIGIPVGLWSAIRQNSFWDRAGMTTMLTLYAIPSFVLIPIFRWINYQFYIHGLPSLPQAGWGRPEHWVMPVIVLSAASMGYIARLTRVSMLEVLKQDYLRTARAKGLRNRRIRWNHAFRNALIPVVTVVSPSIAFLVTGTFVVETLFSIPGLGYLSVQSIAQRDYPVIQSTTVLLAVAVLLMNLITDLLYMLLDPRIRVEA
ncbi:MAG: ABC transporter permease [Anaerolineae bacterium]|nr:ABC transporter permease [Anaerolineae bacterium]MCA9908131.1 ABC transporter permease [Anaerolineae bacterium]